MKTTTLNLLALCAAAVLCSSLSAFTIADANYRDSDFLRKELSLSDPTETGVFNLVQDDGDGLDLLGFNPLVHTIKKAVAGVVFTKQNANGGIELLARLTFQLGTALVEVQGSPTLLSTWSQGVFTLGGNQEFVFSSDSLSGSIVLQDIQDDGKLDWQVSIDPQYVGEGEKVFLWGVYLGVDAEKVPDASSTAAMMGFGLFIITAWASRTRKSRPAAR